jgi:hypothetical protein
MTKINKLVYLLLLGLFFMPQAQAEWVDISPSMEITQSRQALDRVKRVLFSYVTIKNTSAEALADPVRLVITNPSIPMLNAMGTTDSGNSYLQVAGGLAARASIKVRVDFQLHRVRLVFGTKIMQEYNTPSITNINPAKAISGSLISIEGSSFTPTSQVRIGDYQTGEIIYFSQDKIAVVVPFAEEDGAVVALPPGVYPLSVDGGEPSDLMVSPLPDNPNLPGVVLTDTINTLTDGFLLHRVDIESGIDDFRREVDDPAIIEYLDTFEDILPIIVKMLTELPSFAESIDPVTLETLEKALWALSQAEADQNGTLLALRDSRNPSPFSSAAKASPRTALDTLETMFFGNQAIAAPAEICTSVECGDAWLDEQQKLGHLFRAGQTITAVFVGCSFVPAVNAICGPLALTSYLATDVIERFGFLKLGKIEGLRITASNGSITILSDKEMTVTLGRNEMTELSAYVDTKKDSVVGAILGRFSIVIKTGGPSEFNTISNSDKQKLVNLVDITNKASKVSDIFFSSKVSYPISFSRLDKACISPEPISKLVSNDSFLQITGFPVVDEKNHIFKCEMALNRIHAQTLLQTAFPASYSVNFKEVQKFHWVGSYTITKGASRYTNGYLTGQTFQTSARIRFAENFEQNNLRLIFNFGGNAGWYGGCEGHSVIPSRNFSLQTSIRGNASISFTTKVESETRKEGTFTALVGTEYENPSPVSGIWSVTKQDGLFGKCLEPEDTEILGVCNARNDNPFCYSGCSGNSTDQECSWNNN